MIHQFLIIVTAFYISISKLQLQQCFVFVRQQYFFSVIVHSRKLPLVHLFVMENFPGTTLSMEIIWKRVSHFDECHTFCIHTTKYMRTVENKDDSHTFEKSQMKLKYRIPILFSHIHLFCCSAGVWDFHTFSEAGISYYL